MDQKQLDKKMWELLKLTSRTFYLSLKTAGNDLGMIMCVSYLVLRIADFFEDNTYMDDSEKIKFLNVWYDVIINKTSLPKEWKEKFHKYIEEDDDAYAVYHADLVLEALFKLPKDISEKIIPFLTDTTKGMAYWVKRGSDIQNEKDMDDYMFEVAGRVGLLLTEVFSSFSGKIKRNKEKMNKLGVDFGLALQTVNIIRGLKKDYERGWIFIPKSFCLKAGLEKQSDLFLKENLSKSLEVLDITVKKAKGHLAKGMEYINLIPRRKLKIRFTCIWPLLFAVRTLAISERNKDTILGEAKISRKEVKSIVRISSCIFWSNTLLKIYFKILSKK